MTPRTTSEISKLLLALEAPIEVLGSNSEDSWERHDPLRLQAAKCIRRLTTARRPEAEGLVERLQAIIDWADLVLDNPAEFNSHGVRLLAGPVFDEARAALRLLENLPEDLTVSELREAIET